jgi:predicted MFS family arabinose efflux permease
VVGLFLALGGVRSVASPARDELTERLAARGTVAKSFAVVTIGIMLGNTVAPPVFGYLIRWVGVQTTFVLIACVALGATVVTVLVVTKFSPDQKSDENNSINAE